MAPSINVYNKSVNEDEGDLWLGYFPHDTYFFTFDANKYTQLMQLLLSIHPKDYIFTKSHLDLINWLSTQQIKNPIHIYNIDHHHDLGYEDIQYGTDTEKYRMMVEYVNCGNWAAYLNHLLPERFQNYTWIKNANSETAIKPFIKSHFKNIEMTNNIHILDSIHIDKLFVCQSPMWIPPMYRPLFDALKFSFEKIQNK